MKEKSQEQMQDKSLARRDFLRIADLDNATLMGLVNKAMWFKNQEKTAEQNAQSSATTAQASNAATAQSNATTAQNATADKSTQNGTIAANNTNNNTITEQVSNATTTQNSSTAEQNAQVTTADKSARKALFYDTYAGKTMVNLFFEDSTRTRTSFEMAQLRLGIKVISFNPQTSSTNKGESLEDTCLTMQAIGIDALVIRHSQNAYYEHLRSLDIPIINAGDGSGEHPSQCLLDLMTIYEEFGRFDGLQIGIIGDISSSRVAKSNKIALERLGAKVLLIAPDIYQDPTLGSYTSLDECIDSLDVCMLLRVQHERHQNDGFDLASYILDYSLDDARYSRLKRSAIIMHPAPVNRGVEISSHLVTSAKSRIFTQMQNGVYARMAIIDHVLKENKCY